MLQILSFPILFLCLLHLPSSLPSGGHSWNYNLQVGRKNLTKDIIMVETQIVNLQPFTNDTTKSLPYKGKLLVFPFRVTIN